MRKLVESTLVSLDGVIEAPERWASFDGEATALSIEYVASRSLTETAWNATLLGPDPSSAIARLKEQPGKDLIKYGTSRLRVYASGGLVCPARLHPLARLHDGPRTAVLSTRTLGGTKQQAVS